MESRYFSKIDTWAWIAVCGSFLLCGLLLFRAIAEGSPAGTAMMMGITLLLAAFIVPTHYTVKDDELVVRAGVFRSRIAYSSIRRVFPQWSVVASPTWSLDRLAIDFQRGPRDRTTVWISPRDRDRFMEELADAAGLIRRGDVWHGPAEEAPSKDAR